MSVRRIPLWDPQGRPTPFFRSQWARRGATQALGAAFVLIRDGKPTPTFRGLWRASFPTRPPLPDDIANPDGTGTGTFWLVFGD